jgi:chaperonin cofactor prefoldin
MDYEKLIEQYQNATDHWRKNKPDFPDVASSYERAATALATIQAENERLKNKLSELAHLQFDEPGIGERTRLMAENESLRAEVEHWKNAHHQAALNFQQENRECNKVLAELEQVKRELQAYKDTGLEPEDFKRAFHEDAVLKLAGQALGIAPDRLRELAQADKEGRCVVLPAKPDQIIYQWRKGDDCPSVSRLDGVQINADGEITYPIWNGYLIPEDFGKTVFLTREEAALRREQDG